MNNFTVRHKDIMDTRDIEKMSLTEKLRARQLSYWSGWTEEIIPDALCQEAAKRIEQLERILDEKDHLAELDKMRDALKEIAALADDVL